MEWFETAARLLVQGIGIAVLIVLAFAGLVWASAVIAVFIDAVRSKQYARARRRAIDETMECAKQLVQSYGGSDLIQTDRDGLCRAMEHYRKTAK